MRVKKVSKKCERKNLRVKKVTVEDVSEKYENRKMWE